MSDARSADEPDEVEALTGDEHVDGAPDTGGAPGTGGDEAVEQPELDPPD